MNGISCLKDPKLKGLCNLVENYLYLAWIFNVVDIVHVQIVWNLFLIKKKLSVPQCIIRVSKSAGRKNTFKDWFLLRYFISTRTKRNMFKQFDHLHWLSAGLKPTLQFDLVGFLIMWITWKSEKQNMCNRRRMINMIYKILKVKN